MSSTVIIGGPYQNAARLYSFNQPSRLWRAIQATNSLEKMLAHQLAAVHKLAMQQMGQVSYERNAAAESKRINAVARYLSV